MAEPMTRPKGGGAAMPATGPAAAPAATPGNDPFVRTLAGIFPPERILTDAAKLKPYERDLTMPMAVRPRAVVFATERQQVIDAVRACYGHKVPYVARGAGSSLSGGSLPVEGGIVIALKQMNRVLRVDARNRIAVVEPGVVNLDVSRAAAPLNLHYAPDPSSQAFCTIGGNVAFNSGGAHCLKYGMTANHVLGLEVVLADGEVVRLGGESLEPAGPELAPFFVGSEGLFGIALEVTLRLLPRVETYRTVLATYPGLEAAGNAVAMVVASGLLPGALEIMDPLAIRATEAASHAGYPLDCGGLVIVELEGERLQVEAEFERLMDLIRRSGAQAVRIAQSDEERAALWKGRKAAFTAVRSLSKNYIVQDGVVPRGKLGPALAEIERLSRRYAVPVANVFHAGDGNLHPLILYEMEGVDCTHEKAERLAGEILRMCIAMGGSITGEHGVGLEKRAYLPEMYGPAEMALMAEMRAVMDPATIANPGKMLLPGAGRGGGTGQESTVEAAPRRAPAFPEGGGATVAPRDARDVAEAVAGAPAPSRASCPRPTRARPPSRPPACAGCSSTSRTSSPLPRWRARPSPRSRRCSRSTGSPFPSIRPSPLREPRSGARWRRACRAPGACASGACVTSSSAASLPTGAGGSSAPGRRSSRTPPDSTCRSSSSGASGGSGCSSSSRSRSSRDPRRAARWR
jgi:glycolate oxidase